MRRFLFTIPALVFAIALSLGIPGTSHAVEYGEIVRDFVLHAHPNRTSGPPRSHNRNGDGPHCWDGQAKVKRGERVIVLYNGHQGWKRIQKLNRGSFHSCAGWALVGEDVRIVGKHRRQRVVSTWQWPNNKIPVFYTWDKFKQQRDYFLKHGDFHVRGNVACWAYVGVEVEYLRERNWGGGKVAVYNQGHDCFGWMSDGIVVNW